jgi:thiol-disulfide isomerase/thioredoxin
VRRSAPLLIVLLSATAMADAPRHAAMRDGDLKAVLAAIRKPGAKAVLVNVWATWCDPCREEMPDLLRYYRARKASGLRLVLVSADEADNRKDAQRFLATQGVDFPTFLKTGDDMAFINGLEPRWSGALPASILFDGQGHVVHFWSGKVTFEALSAKVDEALIPPKKPK